MIKSILVIAPHQDDELNLIGTLINNLKKNKIDVSIMFLTGGDYHIKQMVTRHGELHKVVKKAGFKNIYFLGYCDGPCYDGEDHIYETHNGTYAARSGKNQTDGVLDDEYCFVKHGIHHELNRENVRADMKECILEVRADMIICCDFDLHPDHRMASLLFEDIMRELAGGEYKPLVLKKFCYAGVWYGRNDYYEKRMRETVLSAEQCFPYSSSEILRFAVDKRTFSVVKDFSKFYRICKLYETQGCGNAFFKITNADSAFFYRDYDNLAFFADINVSSGKAGFINDGKLVIPDTIGRGTSEIIKDKEWYLHGEQTVHLGIDGIIKNPQWYSWIPENVDSEKRITFVFNKKKQIKQLNIYSVYGTETEVEINIGEKKYNFTFSECMHKAVLPENIETDTVSVRLVRGRGIREIEIYDHPSAFPLEKTPFSLFTPEAKYLNRPLAPLVQKSTQSLKKLKKCIGIFYSFIKYDLRGNGILFYIKKIPAKLLQK